MLTGFGDSIMKGVVLRSSKVEANPHYELSSLSLIERCGKLLGLQTNNYSRFGCTASVGEKLLTRYENNLDSNHLVLLEYGGNDSDYNWKEIADDPLTEHKPNTVLDDFISAYRRMIDKVKAIGATPVMLSLPPMDADRYFHFFTRNWTEQQKQNVLTWLGGSTTHITTGHELYNMTITNIARQAGVSLIDLTTDLLLTRDYEKYLCEDGIHPNAACLNRLAESIANQLRPMCARQKA